MGVEKSTIKKRVVSAMMNIPLQQKKQEAICIFLFHFLHAQYSVNTVIKNSLNNFWMHKLNSLKNNYCFLTFTACSASPYIPFPYPSPKDKAKKVFLIDEFKHTVDKNYYGSCFLPRTLYLRTSDNLTHIIQLPFIEGLLCTVPGTLYDLLYYSMR